ncbi:hypothetical protein [Sanguibacter sp. 25GB23B1]|uniref:hypothetical protein n=1 Tax=unclassified Sanguibacter TaxID=2645534 RepID=UPI0032AFE81F
MTDPTAPLDDRLAAYVRAAGRSPSAHNTQPWSPRVVDGTVEVAVVPGRTLPAGDPTFRDLLLGLGAWVESVAVSVAQDGGSIRVEPLPALSRLEAMPVSGPADPEQPVVRLHLVEEPASTLFTPADVRDRRVFRGPLLPAADIWSTAPPLPASLRLLELDAPAMRHLTRLGLAFTASRPAVAAELVQWVRLSPEHPRYRLDGMTDAMLALPAPLARLAAPFTRRPRLHDAALAVGGILGRTMEGLGRDRPLPRREDPPVGDRVRHLVLVASPRAGTGHDPQGTGARTSATEAADSRIGVSELAALEAGRSLQRLWLHAHTRGIVVSPHSEIIDSPLAHGALRRRLGLRRSEVALAVFSAGRASATVPRSPRLTDGG